jgi:hypothetical protein
MPSYTVPVTIKSLVFSENPTAAKPQRIHHHDDDHDHAHGHAPHDHAHPHGHDHGHDHHHGHATHAAGKTADRT